MTNEKALSVLEGIRMTYICDTNECKLDKYDPNELACKMCDEGHEALKIAIEALKKQIPKKSTRAYCPCCGEILGIANYTKKICSCGQKLEFT